MYKNENIEETHSHEVEEVLQDISLGGTLRSGAVARSKSSSFRPLGLWGWGLESKLGALVVSDERADQPGSRDGRQLGRLQ